MKKIGLIILISMLFLSGCGNQSTNKPIVVETETESIATNNTVDITYAEAPKAEEPQNIIEMAKEEVHNAIFKEKTETTQKIVDRLFKDMEYVVVDSIVDREDAYVIMLVTNINAGKAWIRTLENYAQITAENLLSDKQMGAEELYNEYLVELEDTFKASDFIIIPIVVEMEFENYQWVWDFDDCVINAISGNLLAAIEGDINSFSFEGDIEPSDKVPVFVGINTSIYHFNENCEHLGSTYYTHTWKDSAKVGYEPCEHCNIMK